MNSLLKKLSIIDWAVGIGTAIYGLFFATDYKLLWLSSSALSFFMIYYKPAERIERALRSKLTRKKTTKDDSAIVLKEDLLYDSAFKKNAAENFVEKENVSFLKNPQNLTYTIKINVHPTNILSKEGVFSSNVTESTKALSTKTWT